jgi:hypothetical protein
MDVNSILFWMLVSNAIGGLLLGLVSGLLILLGVEAKTFWDRVPPASGVIALTSIACGAVLWAASYLFGADASAIGTILFRIAVADAIAIVALGVACAFMLLFGIEAKGFWDRVPNAAGILFIASLGGGAALYAAGYLFGGLS